MDRGSLDFQSGSALVVVGLILAGPVGAFFHAPLLYYDARPAYVADEGLAATDYRAVNTTDTNTSFEPIPLVEIRARMWVSLYAKGLGGGPQSGTEGARRGAPDGRQSTDDPPTTDLENGSIVAVTSMSAMKLGPISANPLVYASDPRVLSASGQLIDEVEPYLPRNVSEVTNLTIRNERSVEMLNRETRLTTFDGTLVLSNDSRVDVRLYLTRVVRDGELVVVFGIVPASDAGSADQFVTLAENVRLVEWGAQPPESRAAPTISPSPVPV